MQITLEVADNKVSFFLELVKSLSFVKVTKSDFDEDYDEPTKEQLKAEIRQAVKEVNLVKQGKLKSRPVEDLLDEL